MVRSGLQQDVIHLYRQGVRNAFSKPQPAREAFLLHLRYNFRHPPLRARDYGAIEHQLRKFSRTLEMLSGPSVSRISVSDDMRSWWSSEVSRALSSSGPTISTTQGAEEGVSHDLKGLKEDKTAKEKNGQWHGTLPGHGGT